MIEDFIEGFKIDSKEFNKLEPYQDDIVCKDVSQWSDEWYKSILPENNRLSLLFEKWNKEFKGKLRGKLVPIIGYGGTKKSLLALNIAYENIINRFGSCLYSTMEMGATEIINRLIDMFCEPIGNYNPHFELEYHNNKTKEIDAKKFFDEEFAPSFKNNLFITQNTSVEAESFDKLLTKFKGQGKFIDILVVDGIAGMGGKGSETELYSRHSKELKDLANKWNILVLLMCHVSKGGKKTDRDLSSMVRSSEKIIDNSDFYITTSLFEKNDGYDDNYGALRLVNKRGSGNIIDVVYQFDKLRLLMSNTDLEFKQFEHAKGL